MLDSGTSLKLIRQEMLKAVDQADHMNTFGESVSSAWDTICKGGKLIARAVDFVSGGTAGMAVDAIKKGATALKNKISPPEPPPVIEAPGNRPTPEHFMQVMLRVDTLLAKVKDNEDITDKDVTDRDFYLKQVTVWQGELVGDDWPEPQLRNQGGKTAGARIKELKQALLTTPAQATAVR